MEKNNPLQPATPTSDADPGLEDGVKIAMPPGIRAAYCIKNI